MGSTKDWDKEHKPWSEIKDFLLSNYLSIFFQKVMSVREHKILYFDGFAGPGIYNDGTEGSPIIAIKKAGRAFMKAKNKKSVSFIFAETAKARANTLSDTVSNNSFIKNLSFKYVVYDKGFQAAIREVLANKDKYGTYFFYIDPFGISCLDFQMFKNISQLNGLRNCGVEVLLNFSTVGFLREACCVLSKEFIVPKEDITLVDEGFDTQASLEERHARLTQIFGNEDWVDIVRKAKNGEFWRAELELVDNFCHRLKQDDAFKFTTHIPIVDTSKNIKRGGLIKYRLVHMSNHWQGCIAMNNTMIKALNMERQPSLFPVDGNGAYINPADIDAAFRRVLHENVRIRQKCAMGELAAMVISEMGITEKQNSLCKTYIGKLLDEGCLERVEKYTKTGKPSHSFGEKVEVIKCKDTM
ncbi:three-Cys-motif partner protein TcmP [Atopobium fossor]|uniref:three-Cys-motif partner protein TcmP n=1 Tax=Atopobium fossor TaxID=39487 RepID=UPI0003FAF0C4|nr:three-Cys-motif partner protein TcmP [Atopobium fossor]